MVVNWEMIRSLYPNLSPKMGYRTLQRMCANADFLKREIYADAVRTLIAYEERQDQMLTLYYQNLDEDGYVAPEPTLKPDFVNQPYPVVDPPLLLGGSAVAALVTAYLAASRAANIVTQQMVMTYNASHRAITQTFADNNVEFANGLTHEAAAHAALNAAHTHVIEPLFNRLVRPIVERRTASTDELSSVVTRQHIRDQLSDGGFINHLRNVLPIQYADCPAEEVYNQICAHVENHTVRMLPLMGAKNVHVMQATSAMNNMQRMYPAAICMTPHPAYNRRADADEEHRNYPFSTELRPEGS